MEGEEICVEEVKSGDVLDIGVDIGDEDDDGMEDAPKEGTL